MVRLLALGSLLLCCSAFAGPRLFPQPSLLSLTGAELELTAPQAPEPHLPTLAASGVFAGLLATPLALGLGAAIGTLSNDTYTALATGLLPTLLLPPLAVVLTQWLVGEEAAPGRFRLVPALLVAVLAQAAIIVAGVLLGVNATNGSGIAIMTLASAVALPTVTTAMLKLTERPVASVPVLSGNF